MMCGFGTTTAGGVVGTVGVVGELVADAGLLCVWVGAAVTEATVAWSVIVVVVSAEPQPATSARLRRTPTLVATRATAR